MKPEPTPYWIALPAPSFRDVIAKNVPREDMEFWLEMGVLIGHA